MSDKFNEFINRVLKHEGGYVNNPKDPGGETHWGITKQTAREYGFKGDMRQLTREQAIGIYKRAFWERYQCEKLPLALSFQFFDAAINHGYGNAARMLQRAVGAADDGVIGAVTLGAVAKFEEQDLLLRFNAERLRFYAKLTAFNTFGRGWIRRVADNLVYASGDNVGVVDAD